ncbi:O-antigen ligase family protein [Micromonospora echinofusca]|uniref:O-antigen ligase family protein n=1 Tax=Micromonospora echinofusca TaxID=47858 RepID=UPI0033CCA3D1
MIREQPHGHAASAGPPPDGTGRVATALLTPPVASGTEQTARATRTVAATAAGTVGTRLAMLAITLVTGVLTARLLGPQDRGQVAVSFAGASIFAALCTTGRETANLRFTGTSSAMHRFAVQLSLRYVVTAGFAAAMAWGVLGLALWPAARVGLDPATFGLTLVVAVVALLSSLLGTAEIGRTRAATYNLVMIGSLLVFAVLLGVLAVTGRATPVTVVASYLVGQACGAAALLLRARPVRSRQDDVVERAAYQAFARRAYLPNLAQFAMGRSQVPMIQLLAGSTAVGIYSVALPFAELLLILPVALSLVLVPAVANGHADWATVSRLALRTLLITTAGATVIAAGAPIVLPLLFGDEFAGAVPVLWALLPGLAILSVARTMQSYLTAVDRPASTTVAAVLASVAGLAAMMVLIPPYGAVGAGAAVSIAYAGYALVVVPAFRSARPERAARRGVAGAHRHRKPHGSRRVLPVVAGAAGAVVAGLGAGVLSGLDGATLLRIAGAAAILCCLVFPWVGLYLLAAAVPASQLPAPVVPGTTALLVVLLCCLVGTLLRGGPLPRGHGLVLLTGGLIVFLVVGVMLAGHLDRAANSLIALAITLVAVPVVATATVTVHGRRSLLTFAAGCTVVAAAHAAVGLIGWASEAAAAQAANEPHELLNHNAWGPMLVVALAVLLARVGADGPARSRLCAAVGVAVILAGIGFSYSRSSYLGALVVLLWFVGRRRYAVPVLAVGTLAVTAVVGNGLRLLPETILDRIEYTTASGRLDGSSSVRLDLWASALRMAAEHPLSGVGFLGFSERLPAYFSQQMTEAGTDVHLDLLQHPHNTYLMVLAETGLIGAALVVALLVLVVRAIRHHQRVGGSWTAEAGLLALAGIGASSLFGEPLLTLPVLAPFLLALAVAVRRETP